MVSVVTGGSRGIGKGVTEALLKKGFTVIVTARNKGVEIEELEKVYNDKILFVPCDISKEDDRKNLACFVKENFGKLDLLVNNAGITRDAMTRKMTDEQWDLVVDINLKGIFNLVRYIGPFMEEIGGGSIINISSVVGEYGNIGQANYAATKAGVIGLTKTWAKEFARKGVPVRCNAIAPGYIMTDMMKTVPEDLLKKFAGLTMLGRLGQPEEIAKAALFLASDDASYVTGHVLSVNGGMRL